MKIRIRDVGLLTAGFILGAFVMLLSLASPPTRMKAAATPRVVATGPVVDVASLSALFVTNFSITNNQWEQPSLRGLRWTVDPDRMNARGPLYPGRPGSVDLIDTRYRPDIQLDDLK